MLVSGSSSIHVLPHSSASLSSPADPLAESKSNGLKESSSSNLKDPSSTDQAEKSQAEQRNLQQLKIRDREVRAHELAHVSVGAQFITSGATFSYQKGSDGRLYAIGGEVSIDTSPVAGDPRATLLKSQIVARAALAPANPSAQDKQVAAQASSLAQQARVELALVENKRVEEPRGNNIDAFA